MGKLRPRERQELAQVMPGGMKDLNPEPPNPQSPPETCGTWQHFGSEGQGEGQPGPRVAGRGFIRSCLNFLPALESSPLPLPLPPGLPLFSLAFSPAPWI